MEPGLPKHSKFSWPIPLNKPSYENFGGEMARGACRGGTTAVARGPGGLLESMCAGSFLYG